MSRSYKAGIIALGNGIGALANLGLFVVFSRLLSTDDYGTYRQTLLVIVAVAPVLPLGVPLAVYHLLPKERVPGETVSNNLTILHTLGLLWTAFLLLGGADVIAASFGNSELGPLIKIIALLGLFQIGTSSFTAVLVSHDRSLWVAGLAIGQNVVKCSVVICAYLHWRSLESILWTILVVEGVFFPVRLGLIYLAGGRKIVRPRFPLMAEQLKFGIILGLATLLGTIHKQMDKVFVTIMSDTSEFAVFVNGAQEIPFVRIIQGAIVAVLIVEMSKLLHAGELGEAHALWSRAVFKVALIFIPLGVFLMGRGADVMEALFDYRESGPVFGIYALMFPLRSISYGAICIAAGRNDLVLKGAVVGLGSNLVLTPVLIYFYGPIGAAFATVGSIGACVIPYLFFHICQIFKKSVSQILPWKKLFRVSLISLGGILVVNLLGEWAREWPIQFRLPTTAAVFAATTLIAYQIFGYLQIGEVLRKLHRFGM